MFHLIWWIVVGLVAGWITGKVMRGPDHGFFMDILIGIAGAVMGGLLMRALGFAGQAGTIYTILVATGGAVLLTFLYRLITRKPGSGSRSGTGLGRAA
ncbi:MAG TPA: GlsB/YeaQ/YmgE family stress response membrane protein [Terriglobales bacterium]|nr:GlsB/YeaQ/YmgE family stress response membrane protein [Terriglobales bacterium]